MEKICPITNESINAKSARLIALLVAFILAATLATQCLGGALFLVVDFGLRGFGYRKWSPLAWVSTRVLDLLKVAPQPTNAGPKIFAAQLGFLFSCIVAGGYALGMPTVALVVGGLFGVCVLLEAGLGFCVACHLYPFLRKK